MRTPSHPSCRPFKLAVAAAILLPAAWAEPSPALDRFGVSIGAFYPNKADTTFSLEGNGQSLSTGTIDLGEKETVPRIKFDFLLGDSQGLAFDYYRFDRSRTYTDGAAFVLDDVPYDVDATVTGRYRFETANGAYRWWFGKENTVFGVGVGAAYYKLKLEARGEATSNGATVSGERSETEDTLAPMVTLGLRHAIGENVRVYLDGSGVYKNGDKKLHGHIYTGAAGVEFFPFKNVGIGAEYGVTKIKLKRDKDDYRARFDMHMEGPSAFLRMRF